MQIRKNSKTKKTIATTQTNSIVNDANLGRSKDHLVPLPGTSISDDERWQMIAEAAYYRAEKRGFGEGNTQQDWLDAEAEIKARLEKGV